MIFKRCALLRTGALSTTLFSFFVIAAMPVEGVPPSQPQVIKSLLKNFTDHQLEASGIIQISDGESYFVVSDEAENDQAELFRMNARGELVARLVIPSGKPVDDLESISREGGSMYVLSSLHENKKKRRHFLRFHMEGEHVVTDDEVSMLRVLEEVSEYAEDPATRQFLKSALGVKSIELEAHNVHHNDLYLGFKAPFSDLHETVILKLENVSRLFDGHSARGEIWRKVALRNPQTGSPARLSDMLFYKNNLLLLAVSKGKGSVSSHLWSYSYETGSLTLIKTFDQLRAEGVSATSVQDEVMVVFDGGGKKASHFLRLAL